MEITFRLVYSGKPAAGFNREQVRQNLIENLGLSEERSDRILSRSRRIVRSGLDLAAAEHLQDKLQWLGLGVFLEPEQALPVVAEEKAMEMPDTSPPAVQVELGAVREMPFQFTGRARKYFKIWIVNIALTILTLGVYSAWSKVRTQRYFYANTRVDDDGFSYLASPITILKGRVLALAVLLIYLLVAQFYPSGEPVLMLILFILTPWIVVRAFRFRSRNSAFRNIRFGFDGEFGQAFGAYVLYPFIGILTFGLLMPMAVKAQQEFRVDNSRFGTQGFDFSANLRQFYLIVGGSAAIFFVFLLISIFVGAGSFYQAMTAAGTELAQPANEVPPEVALESFLLPLGVFVLGILAARAYFVAKIGNLLFNKSVLGEHRFHSTLSPLKLGYIMLTNWIAVMLTLGLARPWAMVRMARYRADCLKLLAASYLDDFVAADGERIGAVGEELGEAFDVDLGI